MRYAIISDIHANVEALNVVLDEIDNNRNIDKIICLGDVVGYNANPDDCCKIIRDREIPTILGNHDAVACEREGPWGFNQVALEAALWTRENLNSENIEWLKNLPDVQKFEHFIAVHGSPGNRNSYLFSWEDILPHVPYVEEQDCSLCFFGHTHSPGIFSADGTYTVDEDSKFPLGNGKIFFVNPGSVGQPRDGDPRAAFGIIDTETNEYELVRISYPVKQAADRIADMGLPAVLAERLFLGR